MKILVAALIIMLFIVWHAILFLFCVIEPVSASSYQLLLMWEGSSLTALWEDFSESYCRGNSFSLHGNKPLRSVFSTWGWGDKTDDLWGCKDKKHLHYTDRHCTSSSSSEILNILSLFWWGMRWNGMKRKNVLQFWLQQGTNSIGVRGFNSLLLINKKCTLLQYVQ